MAETQPNEFLQALAADQPLEPVTPEPAADQATPEPVSEAPPAPADSLLSEASDGQEPASSPAEPPDVKTWCDQHDVKTSEIHALIDKASGKPIGELINKARDAGSLVADREAFEADRSTFNANRAATISQFDELVSLANGGELTAENVQTYQNVRAKFLQSEQASLSVAIPEWKDATIKEAETREIVEFAARWRVGPTMLANVLNHELMHLIRDCAKTDSRVKELLSNADKPALKGVKSAKRGEDTRKPKSVEGASAEVLAALGVK